jgi:phosphoribosylaminoimidazole (AIR) synthetase
MAKKNRIVSFNKMEPELVNLVRKTFPLGYEEMVKLFNLGVGRSFYAFDLITEECNYLIKVDASVDFSMFWNDNEEAKNEDADSD